MIKISPTAENADKESSVIASSLDGTSTQKKGKHIDSNKNEVSAV